MQLEGSFLKEGNRYSFWAFFPTGDLTGIAHSLPLFLSPLHILIPCIDARFIIIFCFCKAQKGSHYRPMAWKQVPSSHFLWMRKESQGSTSSFGLKSVWRHKASSPCGRNNRFASSSHHSRLCNIFSKLDRPFLSICLFGKTSVTESSCSVSKEFSFIPRLRHKVTHFLRRHKHKRRGPQLFLF